MNIAVYKYNVNKRIMYKNRKIDGTPKTGHFNEVNCKWSQFASLFKGHHCVAISAGPFLPFNPSISFFVNFDPSREMAAWENLDALWNKMLEGVWFAAMDSAQDHGCCFNEMMTKGSPEQVDRVTRAFMPM